MLPNHGNLLFVWFLSYVLSVQLRLALNLRSSCHTRDLWKALNTLVVLAQGVWLNELNGGKPSNNQGCNENYWTGSSFVKYRTNMGRKVRDGACLLSLYSLGWVLLEVWFRSCSCLVLSFPLVTVSTYCVVQQIYLLKCDLFLL